MKYTLLDLTQEVLASMDGDEVNSISDTTEALSVARIIRQAYFDLVEDAKLPSHYTVFELNPSLNAGQPTLMRIPDDINKVVWVKYNTIMSTETAPIYQEVQFLPKDTFLDRMYQLSTDDSNVGSFEFSTVDSSSISLYYIDDKAPQFYTTLDNSTILFDSYDKDVDDTLQKSKTVCYGRRNISFPLVDTTAPELDDALFTRLLNDAKELAFAELKSISHAIAGRNSKRSRNRTVKDKYRLVEESDYDKLPYYGRK